MKLFFISLWFFLLTAMSFVNAQDIKSVPYTLDDRDRAIRTEARIEAFDAKFDARVNALDARFDARINALEEKTDIRFDAVNSRIDYIFWLLGVIVALMLFTLGYIIWDRRTALKPALDKASTADDKAANVLRVLQEYAKKHPDMANILKTHGLL